MSKHWCRFWMRRASLTKAGRFAMQLASISAPPDIEAVPLAYINQNGCGYIAPGARLYHTDLYLGENNFIGNRVLIIQRKKSGRIEFGNKISIYRDCIFETAQGGVITIGNESSVHHQSILKAYLSPIEIGHGVMIAARCTMYSYDHSISLGTPIRKQKLISKGGIKIGNEVWIGAGVTILDGTTIGDGAIIGAGAIVRSDIPENSIAVGIPAKVVKYRK